MSYSRYEMSQLSTDLPSATPTPTIAQLSPPSTLLATHPSWHSSSSGNDKSIPAYQSTSDSSLLLPHSPPHSLSLPENSSGGVEFSDLVSKLNACSWFFIVLLLLLVAGPMLSDGIQGFIISMLLLVPTIAMLKEYASTPVHREIGINSVVQCYGHSMTTAFILCILLEVALLGLAAYISFGDTMSSAPKLTHSIEKNEVFSSQFKRPFSIRTIVFLTIMAFAVAAAPEELMKAITGYPLASDRSLASSKRIYVWACLVASVGFSTSENFGYVFSVPSSELGMRIGLALSRLMAPFPIHVACACLTGIRVTRRKVLHEDISWLSCIGPAVAIHGFFDWFQFITAFVYHSAATTHDHAFDFALFFMTLAPFGFAYVAYKIVWVQWELLNRDLGLSEHWEQAAVQWK